MGNRFQKEHKFSCKAEAFVSPSKRSDGLFLQDLRIQRNSRIQDYWEHQFTCELPNLVFLLFSILTLYKGIDHSFFSGTQKSMFQFQAWFSAFLHHWLQKMGVSIHFAKEKFCYISLYIGDSSPLAFPFLSPMHTCPRNHWFNSSFYY